MSHVAAGSLPDLSGHRLHGLRSRSQFDPAFWQVAMTVLVSHRTRDLGSEVVNVTRAELVVLVQCADAVDDPARLVHEGVVNEGGDPGSSGVVERA